MNKKSLLIGAGILVVLVVVAFSFFRGGSKTVQAPGLVGGLGEPSGFDNIALTGGSRIGVSAGDVGLPTDTASIGKGISTLVTSGTFADASTTLAIIANPFAATSTVTIANIQGTNGTTTVDLLVGSTTVATTGSFTNNSQISATLINSTTVATSTQFFSTAGALIGPGTGYASPGANSVRSIVVGPNENIGIMATSSYAGSSVTGNSGITGNSNTFSGTYTLEWKR